MKKDEKFNKVITTVTVDYRKAIQNLTDILIDSDKFQILLRNIYDACDTDNESTIAVDQVEEFTRTFIRGNQIEGQTNSDFEKPNEIIFS